MRLTLTILLALSIVGCQTEGQKVADTLQAEQTPETERLIEHVKSLQVTEEEVTVAP